MATITKRVAKNGAISWRAQVRVAGAPHRSKTLPRKAEAQAWAAEVERRIRMGELLGGDQERHTVADAIDRYLLHVERIYSHPGSRRAVCSQLAWWRKRIGQWDLRSLKPAHVIEAREELELGGCSGPTTNRYLAALGAVLRTAAREWQWVDRVATQLVRRRKENAGREVFLTVEQASRLLEACDQVDTSGFTADAVRLALLTGARQAELRELCWSDVDLASRRAYMRKCKGGRARGVSLSPQAVEALRRLGHIRKIGDDRVLGGRIPWKQFVKAREAMGMPQLWWHDLRHTFASWLAMSGASLAQLADALGHKSLLMVRRYTHFLVGHLDVQVDAVGARLLPPEVDRALG